MKVFLKKHFLKIIIVFWCLVIFSFSNMDALESGNQSSGLIKGIVTSVCKIANKIGIIEKMPTTKEINTFINSVHGPVRKLAHASIYFILAVLVVIDLSRSSKLSIGSICMLTIIFCFAYSLTDEFHQTFVEGRSGELRDCLIDTLGALVAVCTFYIFKFFKNYNS